MSDIKFVGSLPEANRRKPGRPGKVARLIATLAERPGEWAELDRGPASANERARLSMRMRYLKKADPRVEATTRTLGDEVALFARVVTA